MKHDKKQLIFSLLNKIYLLVLLYRFLEKIMKN